MSDPDPADEHADPSEQKERPKQSPVDEASDESFPASDPPAFSGGIVGAEPDLEQNGGDDEDDDR